MVGFGAGRYATPAKVVTVTKVETKVETRVEWRDREVEKQVQGPVRIVTVTKSVPTKCGGPPVTVTTVTEERGTVTIERVEDQTSKTASATQTVAASTTTVTRDQPRWLLQAGAATGSDLKVNYNVAANYRLIGPGWIGAAYHLTSKQVEIRAGFSF
jgi:hypothetical protein